MQVKCNVCLSLIYNQCLAFTDIKHLQQHMIMSMHVHVCVRTPPPQMYEKSNWKTHNFREEI